MITHMEEIRYASFPFHKTSIHHITVESHY